MGLCVVAVKMSSLLRLTGSSTIVLWRTGSISDERPGPGQHRQRRNTRGPGEGDITGQTWVRETSSRCHGHTGLGTDSDLRPNRAFIEKLIDVDSETWTFTT